MWPGRKVNLDVIAWYLTFDFHQFIKISDGIPECSSDQIRYFSVWTAGFGSNTRFIALYLDKKCSYREGEFKDIL